MKYIDSFDGEYRFLSNFWPVEITYERLMYPSVEHAYQAAKTLDFDKRRKIIQLTPDQAKRAAPTQGKGLRTDWLRIKLQVMEELNCLKFKNPVLRQMLLDTGDAELIEGNTWGDVFWGVCNGVGENHLGKILMKIRDEIRKGKF